MCSGVPYRVLTVSTDIALGYDNISSAIASAVAVLNGANIITAVTSAEHIGLPTNEQIEEAVITAKIAAHSAELCKNDCIDRDRRMSITRMKIGNCQGSIDESIYPQGAKKALLNNESHMPGCSMCGRFCALIKE
jgi:phosphomethylpyrimidine synthase